MIRIVLVFFKITIQAIHYIHHYHLTNKRKMKFRLLSTLMVLFSIIAASAQEELKVKSILPSINDLSARTTVRNDNSGESCALVKVVLPDKDASFECGNLASMIVGDISFHTNEYWVYLVAGTNGAKHLKIKVPNCPTIDNIIVNKNSNT